MIKSYPPFNDGGGGAELLFNDFFLKHFFLDSLSPVNISNIEQLIRAYEMLLECDRSYFVFASLALNDKEDNFFVVSHLSNAFLFIQYINVCSFTYLIST